MTTVLIANPTAAAGKAARKIPRLESLALDRFGSCEIFTSDFPGDVTRLVGGAVKNNANRLIIVGGDGTVNEAINGLVDDRTGELMTNPPSLLFVPSGTGGDFARSTGADSIDEEHLFFEATPRKIDVGRMELICENGRNSVRHFINTASFGVSAAIAHRVNKGTKKIGGRAAFALAALSVLSRWRDREVKLTVDGHFHREITISAVVVANGCYFGGGMKISPDSVLDDGLFDIVLMENLGVMKFLYNSPKVYRGDHFSVPGITHLRGSTVTVEPSGNSTTSLPIEIDGESPGNAPAKCTILKRAIEVLAPWSRSTN